MHVSVHIQYTRNGTSKNDNQIYYILIYYDLNHLIKSQGIIDLHVYYNNIFQLVYDFISMNKLTPLDYVPHRKSHNINFIIVIWPSAGMYYYFILTFD